MSTIDFTFEPQTERADLRLCTQADLEQPHDGDGEAAVEEPTWSPGRERVIRFVQHPSYRGPAPTHLRAA